MKEVIILIPAKQCGIRPVKADRHSNYLRLEARQTGRTKIINGITHHECEVGLADTTWWVDEDMLSHLTPAPPDEPDVDDGPGPQAVADEDFRRHHPHDGDTE